MRSSLLCASILAAACATAAPDPALRVDPDVQDVSGRREHNNRYRMDADEIAAAGSMSVYDLLLRARPEYLIARGPVSILLPTPATPAVYVDRMELGGIDQLRSIPTQDVAEIRFYPVSAASAKFGSGHPAGVIEVTTRTQ